MRMNIMMDAKDLYAEPYHPVKPHMKRDYSGDRQDITSLTSAYRASTTPAKKIR
jgi:hypothetical protein